MILQLVPAATTDPQVLLSLKRLMAAPERETEVRLRSALPVFVNCTIPDSLEPAEIDAKVSEVGLRVTTGAVAVPVNCVDIEPPGPLSCVNVTAPVNVEGVPYPNVTDMAQLAPGAKTCGHVFCTIVKPVPVREMLSMGSAPCVVLVRITS